ncbi:MAG: amidohydrolase family protein [Planctomycetota bacterium]|nr:amidohydrolase family protein [Planctomycetota bacterium]
MSTKVLWKLRMSLLSILCPMILFSAGIGAAADIKVFTGARLMPVSGPVIEDGALVVRDGKIESLGAREDVVVPTGAENVDVSGKTIIPGLICTHSHIGMGGGGDSSGPIQPECWTLDSVNVRSASLERARAGGLTLVNQMPGSGHLISGRTTYLKLRKGGTVDELLIKDESGWPMGGLKMANGTNSQRSSPFPGTRAKSAALVRESYVKAQEYRDKIARAEGDPEKMPERNLRMEALVEALEGKRIVHHHTHRHDDILTVLRLRDEFGFQVVLHHVSDAWKVVDEIAAAKAPCSIIVIDSPGGKLEARDIRMENGVELEKAGVNVAFHTDDFITDSRLFLRSAALGARAGMSREGALRALTLSGAEMLGLEERTGSLEPGKDADFVILSGDPLSVYTQVLETWVEGIRVFDRSDPEQRLFAVGGRGAGDDQAYQCCGERGEQ